MHVKEAIASRRSIRTYTEASISPEHMQVLFRALQLAASGSNIQNWEFVLVGDPDLKRLLVPACLHQTFVAECAYFIAGIADPALKWHQVDITIALTNFTLQAVELGYGTCWIGAFDENRVKDILGVPDWKKIVVCMTFGMPKGKPFPSDRKPLEEFIYLNHYGTPWKPSA